MCNGLSLTSIICIGSYAIVKCVANNADFDLTHYMVFKDGDASIYMGTYTASEPSIGEVRAACSFSFDIGMSASVYT